jgi:tRNA(His) guanylyltransferase
MAATFSDPLSHFPSATMAYTQSDEITLVFPSGIESFNDRVQKICSLAATFTSVKFNMHLASAVAALPMPAVKNAENILGTAHFNGRLFTVPSVGEALNCVLWRFMGMRSVIALALLGGHCLARKNCMGRIRRRFSR